MNLIQVRFSIIFMEEVIFLSISGANNSSKRERERVLSNKSDNTCLPHISISVQFQFNSVFICWHFAMYLFTRGLSYYAFGLNF